MDTGAGSSISRKDVLHRQNGNGLDLQDMTFEYESQEIAALILPELSTSRWKLEVKFQL